MKFTSIIKNQIARESALLFFAQSLNVGLGGLVYMIIRPNLLNPHDIGLISYVNSLVSTLAIFFNFGLDNTGCRLILNEKDPQQKKRIAGMTLFISLILCVLFSLFLYIVTFFIPYFGNIESTDLVRLILPFSSYGILQFFITNLCYAIGSIKIASFITVAANALYLPLIIILYKMNIYTVKVAILSEYSLQMLVLLFSLIFVGGKQIRAYKDLWQPIKDENKTVGLKVFSARIVFLPTFDIDKLILGAFHSIENVGFFTIAKMFAGPIIVLGQSISQSLYRRYADKDGISKRIVLTSLLCILFLAFNIMVFSYFIIKIFLNDQYYPILYILPLAVIAAIINGFMTVYTSFMDAKGMAKELRNIAIVGMISSIVLNFSLIIPFAMIGGMISRIIVLIIILLMRMYYCNKYSQHMSDKSNIIKGDV